MRILIERVLRFWCMFILFIALVANPEPTTAGFSPALDQTTNFTTQTSVADSWQFPLDGAWSPIAQPFNVWNGTWNGNHLGQDITRTSEVSVRAAANGRIKYSGAAAGYGNVVIIEHQMPDSSYFISLYGHLKPTGLRQVETDVSKGDIIGTLSGVYAENGGYNFIHLHFGIREGTFTSQTRTCGGKTTWLYRGYSCAADDLFSASHWRKGDDFILQHSSITPTCPAPTNGIPRDNNIFNNNQVSFSWTPPSCSNLDYYTFRVSNHADIDNSPWIIDHGVSKDSTSITETIPAQYNGQTLYWAIWPHNSAGYGSKSSVWSFKIDTSTPPVPPPLPSGSWSVEYFSNKELTNQCGDPTSFTRTFIFQDWGDGVPASGCNSDNWGARFTRRVTFQGGNYNFAVEADDWGRIYVDNTLFVDKWNGASQHYEGHYVSPGDHDVRIEFADTMGAAKISAWWWGPGFDIPHDTQDPNQWFANYWINPTQWWDAFVNKNEGTGILSHEWSSGGPGWDMPTDNFSAKFQRTVTFECGTYRFILDHDDGAKLWIDSVLKVDRWNGAIGYYTIDLPMTQGSHLLQVDYYENGGSAHISFDWQQLSGCNPSIPTLISPANSASLSWNTDLTLMWNALSGATQYFVQLQGGPGVVTDSGWIAGTTWHVAGLWPGIYSWSVTAGNDYGSSLPSSTATFTIQNPPALPPIAEFDAFPLSGKAPFKSTLHIVSMANITSCAWDYGDGTTSTVCTQTHDHVFNNPGTYTVSFSAYGAGGMDSATRSSYITVTSSKNNYLPSIRNGAAITTATFLANANDVEIGNLNISTWSECRSANSANYLLNGYPLGTVAASKDSNGTFTIKRIFLFFDTTQIPTGAIITNVELHLHAGAYVNGSPTIYVIKSSANTPVTNGAFQNVDMSTAALSFSPTPNTWINKAFNANARAWVNKGGITKLALIADPDLANYAPSNISDALFSLAEDPSYAPYLIISYQP